MSKRPINTLGNQDIEQEQNITNNEVDLSVNHNHQSKSVCRATYITNLPFENKCSTSKSAPIQWVVENVCHDELEHFTSIEIFLDPCDKKGKKVVNMSNDLQNKTDLSFDIQNFNLTNKGQAFFQRNRTDVFLICLIIFLSKILISVLA